MWRGQVVRNVQKDESEAAKDSVGAVLRKWNKDFARMGVSVGLELPKKKKREAQPAEGSECERRRGCGNYSTCEDERH